MKKIILACVATILSLSFINAQETAEDLIVSENMGAEYASSRPILLGVTVGANMTTYSGDRNPKMGLGGQIGINCDIPINDYFSIMPELLFAYKTVDLDNVSWDNNNELMIMKSTDHLLYMNVPVYVKGSLHVGIGRPFIAIGPMINVGLYGENRGGDFKLLLFQADPNAGYVEYREKPPYNNLDFSVCAKAGYDFDFGLSISVAYQLGFANMYKMTNDRKLLYNELGLDTSQKNSTISVSLGYNF